MEPYYTTILSKRVLCTEEKLGLTQVHGAYISSVTNEWKRLVNPHSSGAQ